MALHEQSVGRSDEWYTPPHVFDALGCRFDVDVASPGHAIVPWIPADTHMTSRGLYWKWSGFIWMNPPFGKRNGIVPWLERFFEHGDGIALTPDRTSAPWWQQFAPRADAILFVSPKLRFISGEGHSNRSPAQGTSLMALGATATNALRAAERAGLGCLFLPTRDNARPQLPQPKEV